MSHPGVVWRLGCAILPAASFLLWVTVPATAAPQAVTISPPAAPPAATTRVTVSGTFPTWPVGVWTDRGQLAWACAAEPGHFDVVVPADGAIGLHRVRFHDPAGVTAVRRFLVDPLPAQGEAEPNDTPRSAQRITLPTVVDGILDKAGQVDCFRVDLLRGQRLVAAVEAHGRLASPFDPGLDLVDARGALVERNLDAAGLDPRILHVADRDGPVVVRVFGLPETPDSTIGLAGGDRFVYRLFITTGPVLTGCVPGALAGDTAAVPMPRGLDLPGGTLVLSGPGTSADPSRGQVRTAWCAGAAGLVELPLVDCPVIEAGPWPGATPLVTLPACVTGCLERSGEARGARFRVAKGAGLAIECAARSSGSSADPVVVIHDAAGRRLFVHDTPDERFTWKAPAEGDYQIAVVDRRDDASPWHAFRLMVEPQSPAVRLTVAGDSATGSVGRPITVEVAIDRQNGFSMPLVIGCDRVPAGVEAPTVLSPAEGDTAKKVSLVLTCPVPFSGPVRIVARPDGMPEGSTLAIATCGPEQVIDLWLTATPAAP